MLKCLIVAGGSFPSIDILQEALEETDIIIAVDKGYEYLYANGVIPDYLLGDFDSITHSIPDSNVIVEKYPTKKAATDLEIAIDKAISLNVNDVVLLGCTGTRIDHTFMNIFLLEKFLQNEIKAKILDDNNEIFMDKGKLELRNNEFKYFSIIPLHDNTTISIAGSKYELENCKVSPSNSMTISNEFLLEVVKIQVDKKVLIIKSRD